MYSENFPQQPPETLIHQLKEVCAVLSLEIRMKILLCLENQPRAVLGIVRQVGGNQSGISGHLKIMRDAGLVNFTKAPGHQHVYQTTEFGEKMIQFIKDSTTPTEEEPQHP